MNRKKRAVRIKRPANNSSVSKSSRRSAAAFPVVGVGASAGGLQAFQELLRHLPTKTGMALVLVQHLEPSHESHLDEILSRQTKFTVVQGHDGQRLEPDHIYTIPPNAYLAIESGKLKVTSRRGRKLFLPVDHFLISLAKEYGNQAVAVILSGTGSDGAEGVKAVHAAGGFVLAQDEKTAQYPEMPASAVATRDTDYVLSPGEIAAKLPELKRHPGQPASKPADEKGSGEDRTLAEIFPMLRKTFDLDFSHYKPTTLKRRLKRRMAMQNLRTPGAYLSFLRNHPEEAEALYRDFLIPVTSFFRDPDYYDFLKKKVYPALTEKRGPEDTIRVWVPGCSTGEEAYSLAITLRDYVETRRIHLPIQIFGTDVNEKAVAKARLGEYPTTIAKNVPPALLRRYFVKYDHGYRIDKSIRDVCLFSRHNIISDPPFSNIDLISFRNVLIYMDASLQGRIIPLLHFSLKPNGFLMLGTSESISAFPKLFVQSDKRYKIYAHGTTSERARLNFTPARFTTPFSAKTKVPPAPEAFLPEKEVDRALLKKYVPAGVLVNQQLDILQFRGHTGAYLEPAPGRANLNLMGMVREGLWADLRKAIEAAGKHGTPARRQAMMNTEHGVHNVILEVTPLHSMSGKEGTPFLYIAFETAPAVLKERPPRGRAGSSTKDRDVSRLKQENSELKEYLQSLRAEMENSSEELKAVQEEMQSSNEELQTMNEELETSKEELQSSNEELITTNEELKNKNQDLVQINNDLGNVLGGIELPLVILDHGLRIRRFTAAARKVMNLVDSDLGRHVSEIKFRLPTADLDHAINRVLAGDLSYSLDLADSQGGWYTLVIKPYLTSEHKVEGAVMSFYDVTRIKESQIYMENIVMSLWEPLIVLDENLKVVSANPAFFQTFKVKAEETIGRYLYHLGAQQWDIPRLRELLEKIIPENSLVEDFTLTHTFPTIGTRTMVLNARRIRQARGKIAYTLLAINDITEQHRRQEELRATREDLLEANRRKDEFLAMLAHELRNPLSPIQTSLELLHREPENRKEKTAKRLNIIQRQVTHLARILDDLLDTSRITQGLTTLKKERMNLADAVSQTIESFQSKAESKRQVLSVTNFSAPVMIDADPVRISQILINLLTNAHKYTPEGGSISLRCRRAGGEALVEIRDSGIGIAPQILRHVFDLFYQADKGLDRAKGGLGLGLTLAKNLATLHQGTIEAASGGLNQGSTFTLRLPVASESAAPPEPAPQPAPTPQRATSRKILVVEDNVEAAESLGELLRAWGYEVQVAYDGPAALEKARAFKPDVILLDIGLPGMDGYEIAARFHADPRYSRTVLAALTGYAPDKSRVDQAGFREYFSKPIDIDRLERFLAAQA